MASQPVETYSGCCYVTAIRRLVGSSANQWRSSRLIHYYSRAGVALKSKLAVESCHEVQTKILVQNSTTESASLQLDSDGH